MKKFLTMFLSLALALTLAFSLVACADDNGTGDEGGNGGEVAVTGVTLSPKTLELEVGETSPLSVTIAPSNATDKSVSWESSNTAVATVSNGTVTAIAAGTATITVTTADGGKTDTCAVTVTQPAPQTQAPDLAAAIEATLDAQLFYEKDVTATVLTFLNEEGQPLSAEDGPFVLPMGPNPEDVMEFNGEQLLQFILTMINEGVPPEEVTATMTVEATTCEYMYDYESGILAVNNRRYGDSGDYYWYEAVGSDVNLYVHNVGTYGGYFDESTQQWVEEEVPYDYYSKESYTGYSDNATAKRLMFADGIGGGSDGFALFATTYEFGNEDGSVSGTLAEIEELFDYDGATSTFTADLFVTMEGVEGALPVTVTLKVEDGKVTLFSLEVSVGRMSAQEALEMPFDGLFIEMKSVISSEFDFNINSLSVPEEFKNNVDPEHIEVHPAVNQDAWTSMLTGADNSRSFEYLESIEVQLDNIHSVGTRYYVSVSADKMSAMVVKVLETSTPSADVFSESYTYEHSAWYYKIVGDTLKTYTAEIIEREWGGWEIIQWNEPTTSEAPESVITLLPDAVQDWYAGFTVPGSEALQTLAQLFGEFTYTELQSLSASLNINGNAVTVEVDYGSWSSSYNLYGITVRYNEAKRLWVSMYSGDVSYYDPDTYEYNG